nr:unnamed protein product [Callosobruchus analis]
MCRTHSTQLTQEKDALQKSLETLRSEKAHLDRVRLEVTAMVESLNLDYDRVQKSNQNLQKELSNVQNEKSFLQAEVERLNQEADLREIALRGEEDRCSRMREELLSLEDEKAALQHISSDHQNDIQSLKKELLQTEQQKLCLESDKTSLSEKCKFLEIERGKIITATICRRIEQHLTQNNILTEEQKGCRKKSKGCKEQLIIDSAIMEQARKQHRNRHTCFIDYQKAFDSVPHSWLTKILQIYKINPGLLLFLAKTMESRRTNIHLKTQDGHIQTEELSIRRGIFQGDSVHCGSAFV